MFLARQPLQRLCALPVSRFYRTTASLYESAEFKEAAVRVKTASSADTQQLLKLYALFKQATVGANATPKPGMMDFVV